MGAAIVAEPSRFAALFTAWLQAQGLTANGSAARLGISHVTAYNYAAGTSLPPRTRLPSLAIAMGVDLAELTAAVEADRSAPVTTTQAAPAAGW